MVLTEPVYQGVRANAPIPASQHIRNEGGSDGSGLCVVASGVIAGAYQGVEDLADLKNSRLWKIAKSREGGYWPERWEKLLNEVYPDATWFSWESPTTEQIEAFNAQGLPVCTTTNTGALYNYDSIHHWVDTIHLDDRFAMLVDNNDPGKYHAMPRAEFDRRFPDGGKGWAFVWLVGAVEHADVWILVSVIVCVAGVLFIGPSSAEQLEFS